LFDRPKPTVGCSASGRRICRIEGRVWRVEEFLYCAYVNSRFAIQNSFGARSEVIAVLMKNLLLRDK
jgi:hypothetical protein